MTWGGGWGKSKCRPKSAKSGGVRKKKGRSSNGSLTGWLSNRKKLDNMMEECSDILSRAGAAGGENGCIEPELEDELEAKCDHLEKCDQLEDQTGGKVISCSTYMLVCRQSFDHDGNKIRAEAFMIMI